MLYRSSPKSWSNASCYCWCYPLLVPRHWSESRLAVSAIAGFGLQFHAEGHKTHHVKHREFCGGDGGIDAIVQRHLNVRIEHTNVFVLFSPKFRIAMASRSASRNPALQGFMARVYVSFFILKFGYFVRKQVVAYGLKAL